MTATSDEDGGGPFGDPSHDHASAEEAEECERCDEYTARVTGMPSRHQYEEMKERRDRREWKRLAAKYGVQTPSPEASTVLLIAGGDRPAKEPRVFISRPKDDPA